LITHQEIESAVTSRYEESFESSVFLPVLQRRVPLFVWFDPNHHTISERQLRCLDILLAVPPTRLHDIKEQLYARWGEYDHFYTDEIDFEYDSAEAAFAASTLSGLFLYSPDFPEADYAVLRFRVEWDPEHGAGVYFDRGVFHWCP
jgi:hypothetical protein